MDSLIHTRPRRPPTQGAYSSPRSVGSLYALQCLSVGTTSYEQPRYSCGCDPWRLVLCPYLPLCLLTRRSEYGWHCLGQEDTYRVCASYTWQQSVLTLIILSMHVHIIAHTLTDHNFMTVMPRPSPLSILSSCQYFDLYECCVYPWLCYFVFIVLVNLIVLVSLFSE